MNVLKKICCAAAALAAATLLGYLFKYAGFPETNIVLLYTLAVLVTGCLAKGYVCGILTAVAATLTFNYFFTSPYHSLNVDDPSYMITFAIMTMVSVVAGILTSMVRTNAKEAEQKAQEIEHERYRGNLLRAISHDLRTPFAGIMGTSEMIMDMTKKDDPRYEMAKGISKDAKWLHGLVENILSLTKLQEGRMVIKKQPEAVEEIIEGALAQMASRAPEYEIKVELPDELLMASMDGKLMMQVLINLLDNAVKHTQADKEIKILAAKSEDGKNVIFKVLDEGDGIAQEDLPNIFGTFYTSKIKPADAKKGIGLGLAICESIVEAHGGRIYAENRKDRSGAQFTFTLPLDTGEEAKNHEHIQ